MIVLIEVVREVVAFDLGFDEWFEHGNNFFKRRVFHGNRSFWNVRTFGEFRGIFTIDGESFVKQSATLEKLYGKRCKTTKVAC